MSAKTHKPTARVYINELLLWLLPAYIALAIIITGHYLLSVQNDQQFALRNEQVIVNLIEEVLGETLTRMSSDAKNLSYVTRQIQELHGDSPHSLVAYFKQLSENNASYDQIRYIDAHGMERLRINNINGNVSVVEQSQLQNKSHRYYWQRTKNLEDGMVYISPMDLNIEGGIVEQPLNPTIRVGTPVFSGTGKLTGAIILNYKGRQLINKLFTIAPSFINHLYLINPQGLAVIHPSDNINSDFQFTTNQEIDSGSLSTIKASHDGQFLRGDNYYTFTKVNAPNNGEWIVISTFPIDRFNLSRLAFSKKYTWFYITLLIFISIAATVFSRYRVQTRVLRQQRRYEQQFRHTLENIHLAAVSINTDSTITFCNDFFLQMVGFERHEVIGHNWIERFIPKELQVQASEALSEAIKRQTHQPHSESVVVSKSGEIHLVSWTSTFTESNDNVINLTLLGQDVTEQKMAQDQLQQLSHAVEQSQNSVMITDLSGKIVYVNPVFCQLTGYSHQEVMGLTPKFLQSGEMDENEYQKLWHNLEQGKEWRGEFHNRKKNGQLYWERAHISPVKDSENNTLYYVAVKQDISEEKRLLKEVDKQTQRRLQHEKLAAVGKVVNMIAHDLRNPLSSIKMVLQINARKSDDEMFAISLEQVRYMEAIMEDLLSYSKPELFQPEWLDINKLLETIIASQQKVANKEGIQLVTAMQPNLPTVYADPVKLRQALQNILHNAMQAANTKDTSLARVSIASNIMITDSNTELLIEIENNGKSIDPCLTNKVFEPFFTTKAKGTGLGLAIVKRIIDSHHGQIQLHSLPDGTLAKIRIPTAPHVHTEKQEVISL